MRSMLVIGLGRFGKHLAIRLTELGNEVLVIDTCEDSIDKIAPFVTKAQIGDCMDPSILSSIGVRNFDVCFVCIGAHFQSSLEITLQLKDLGAKRVVSKTYSELHAKFLFKIGADEVIYPERDMAYKTAVKYSAKNAFDYIELSSEYALFEVLTPVNWAGNTVRELNVRSKHNINIIGIRSGEKVIPFTDADYRFNGRERILIAGSKDDLLKLTNKK